MELDQGNYGSPRWSYEILDCAMPMTFDTYSNCAHQCLYCFSFFQRAIGDSADDYLHHRVRSVDVERVKKMFVDPDKYGGQFKGYIKKRMTLQWGGLSDGFDWYEKKFLKSLDLLRFFIEIDYPISISTKGVWWVYDERYRSILKGAKNVHVKYSIITDIEEHVKAIEPGVPTAAERFAALRELSNLDIGATTLRYRPFIVGTSDLCIDSMMKSAEDAGCYSVTTEFLGWESRASNTSRSRLEAISKVVGYDVWDFYLKNSNKSSGLMRLNYDYKRPYIKHMKEAAEAHNLKFFVSDAHHKEESYHAGCCGLPETGPLSNVNRGQYAHAIKLAKQNGFVKWSDIGPEAKDLLNDIPVIRAEGFPSDTAERMKRQYQSMYDLMHDIWNTPKSWQSPARYFGGALVPAQPDENGDIVYLYNKPFIELEQKVGSVNELAIFLKMTGKPNAERYDEMTADGTNHGHVGYPVFVFSRKRWATAKTMALLDSTRLNYTLVVSEEDFPYYSEKYQNADIIVVPQANSIKAARQMVYERCKEEGYPYVWMLDDDIQSVSKGKDDETVTLRNMLSTIERFIEDYTNIAVIGASEDDNTKGLYTVNARVAGVMLVNLQTGIDFSGASELYEDIDFELAHLDTGKWVTVSYNDFYVAYSAEASTSGGASHLYLNELNGAQYAKYLAERYPVPVTVDGNNYPIVNWKAFSNAMRSRNVDELIGYKAKE